MTPEEANAQLNQLAQRRAIANAMLQSSMAGPSGWGQDRFRHSPWEAVANLATTYLNKKNLDKADASISDAQKARQAEIAQALSQYEGASNDPAVGPQGRLLAQRTLENTAVGPEQVAQLKIQQALTPLKKPTIGDVKPEDFTAESLSKFSKTRDYRDLTPINKEPGGTADYQNYQTARSQGYAKSFVDYQIDLARARAQAVLPPPTLQNTERPTGGGQVQPGAFNTRTGQFEPQGPAVTPPGAAKQTQQEATASLLYGEMRDAAKQLDEAGGSDTSSIGNAILGAVPGGSALQGQKFKAYEAAGLRWAQNFLYLKSGASAPAEEVRKTFVQYLPQPGDGQTVKDQKAIARQQAEENVATANRLPAPPVSRGAVEAEMRRRGLNPNARP